MGEEVYTNYWVNRRNKVKKQHGSYKTEEEALRGIEAWWELHKENYNNIEKIRTNTGALEITYGDDNYAYRIEKNHIKDKLPSKSYKLKSKGEIEMQRKQLNLDDETFLFDELAEPYRDRLIVAMANSQTAREFLFNEKGRPIVKIEEYKHISKK